jgi:hypothetical protein
MNKSNINKNHVNMILNEPKTIDIFVQTKNFLLAFVYIYIYIYIVNFTRN